MASKSPDALKKRADYQRKYQRQWREANPNYDHAAHYTKHGRTGHLRRKYGINESQYQMMYLHCEGCCHICGKHEERLVVDHKHGSQDIRGLLCKQCNFILGHAKDNAGVLRLAAAYLERRVFGPYYMDWQKAQNILKDK